MVQAFARGATVGFSRGLAKRNGLLARLVSEGTISRRELREVAQLSDWFEALSKESGLEEAALLRAEEIMVQAFARGATVGFSRGLAKRNGLLARLVSEGTISRRELREVAQLSDAHLRKILRQEGIPAATPERSSRRPVVLSARRRK